MSGPYRRVWGGWQALSGRLFRQQSTHRRRDEVRVDSVSLDESSHLQFDATQQSDEVRPASGSDDPAPALSANGSAVINEPAPASGAAGESMADDEVVLGIDDCRFRDPEDSDGNGYPDRVHAMCAVFVPGRAVAVPADGAFVLTLWKQGEINREGSEPIAEWRFEADELAVHESRNLIGVVYQFTLDTLPDRDDRTGPVFADIRARFEPAYGETVYTSDQVRPVRLGR